MDQMLKSLFDKAVEESKALTERPDNETLLKLYSLFKQSTEGDCTGEPPSNPFDFVNKAKHEAWSGLRGTLPATAMQEYIQLVNKLKSAE